MGRRAKLIDKELAKNETESKEEAEDKSKEREERQVVETKGEIDRQALRVLRSENGGEHGRLLDPVEDAVASEVHQKIQRHRA